MSGFESIAGIAAGIFSLAAYAPYIVAILRGKTKPNRASWVIWVLTSGGIFFSSLASGASDTLWMPGCYMVCSSVIVLLSLKYGEDGWTSFDLRCLIAATIGLVLWGIFDTPLIAIIIGTSVDVVGALPTIRKSYHKPESEDELAWALFFLGSVANVLAIKEWSFVIALYPIVMVALIGLIAVLVVRPCFITIAKKT